MGVIELELFHLICVVEISTLSKTSCKWNLSVPIHEFCLSVHARHIGYGCLLCDLNTNNDIVASTVVTNTKKKIHIRMQHQLDLVATITRFLSWHHPTTITFNQLLKANFSETKKFTKLNLKTFTKPDHINYKPEQEDG